MIITRARVFNRSLIRLEVTLETVQVDDLRLAVTCSFLYVEVSMRYVYLARVEGDSKMEEGNVRRDGSRSGLVDDGSILGQYL